MAASFIVRYVQPCKERAHAGFDFKGDTDRTWERTEMLSRDDVQERATELFAPFASFNVLGMMRPFNCKSLPPQVNIPIVFVPNAFYPLWLLLSSELIHLCKDPFVGKSGVLLRHVKG